MSGNDAGQPDFDKYPFYEFLDSIPNKESKSMPAIYHKFCQQCSKEQKKLNLTQPCVGTCSTVVCLNCIRQISPVVIGLRCFETMENGDVICNSCSSKKMRNPEEFVADLRNLRNQRLVSNFFLLSLRYNELIQQTDQADAMNKNEDARSEYDRKCNELYKSFFEFMNKKTRPSSTYCLDMYMPAVSCTDLRYQFTLY
jgi:hypothetical protein